MRDRLLPSAAQLLNTEADRRMALQRRGKLSQQKGFEHAELLRRRRSRKQPLAQLGRRRTPKYIERNGLVREFAQRQAKERERSPGPEMHSHGRHLVLRVDDEKPRARAGDDASRRSAGAAIIVAVVEINAVLMEVDDQLHRRIRQQALPLVRGRRTL